MKIFLLIAFATVGPLGLGTAFADSDGYYCIGGGYLAYQFGMAPLPVAPHHLYVLRIGTTTGITEPAEIELPQFQVHGLRCGEGWIDVAAFSAIYHVTVDVNMRPVRYEVRPLAAGSKIPPEFLPQLNLGTLSQAGKDLQRQRVSLGMKDSGGQFLLEMTAHLVPSERCRVALTTRIVETDRNGREVRERIIFQGRGTRDCGG